MPITPSQKPHREWLWLVLALVLVGGITVPSGNWPPRPRTPPSTGPAGRPSGSPNSSSARANCMLFVLRLGRHDAPESLPRGAPPARGLGLDMLPTDEGARILPEDARPLARKIEATTRQRPYILAKMIQMALTKFSISRKAVDVGEVVRMQADVEQNRLVTGMSTISYLVWAHPGHRVPGTVRGLAGGMSKAGNQKDADFIEQVSAQLGIAFDCTFVALALSVVLMALLHMVQKAEELLIIDFAGLLPGALAHPPV